MSALDSTAELMQLLENWEVENENNADLTLKHISTLTRIAELVEKEVEAYLKMDPDPFDDRHPSRAYPDCTLGHLLKILFKNDNFMNKLVNNYIMHRDNRDLSTVGCRLLLDILPGLETSVVFQDTVSVSDGLVNRLFQWAENAVNPLQSYATGLLAASMEVQDIAANFREQNSHLVPVMLKRLHELSKVESNHKDENFHISERPFSIVNKESQDKLPSCINKEKYNSDNLHEKRRRSSSLSPARTTSPFSTGCGSVASLNECSNSSWAELEHFMIGSFQMHPLTAEMQQRFILQYLTPMGEYQELLSYVFEHNALSLILHYVNLKENRDVRLAFEALKYLAALLCHKKFAIEFINVGGLQKLLQVYRPSVAATGVSICLYYLAYSEDAMERVCLLSREVLGELVKYALWLLECSHDSSRCHATMFFGLTFAFRVILELFDRHDGLRKLFNVISTLNIFVADSGVQPLLSDDQVFASRQTARHVCVALRRYYETHVIIKAEQLGRSHSRNQGFSPHPPIPPFKAARYSFETIQENIELILEFMPVRMKWDPVDEFLKLGGVTLLLKLIAMSYEWNTSGRADTIRSALDVLTICSVTPKTQLDLTESVQVVENQNTVGLSIVLAAAEGEIVADPDVQRSALNVIINCVCGPMSRMSSLPNKPSGSNIKKKSSLRSGEDLLSKMWNCVRSNNGIMILLNLLTVKTPIIDADSIRTLACKALCGLARCETVKQIISKLPLFTNGQLQVLMREPVLQDKRQEHVKFCKHCLELIERVTGAPLTTGIESSILKINKAEVVAQTKIVFNEKELLQLIHQHLMNKGFIESATTLQKEAALPSAMLRVSSSSLQPVTTINKVSRPISTSSSSCHQTNSVLPPNSTIIHSSVTSSSVLHDRGQTYGTVPSSPSINSSPNLQIKIHHPARLQCSTPKSTKNSALQKSQSCSGEYQPTPVMKRQSQTKTVSMTSNSSSTTTITLDSIITEYLRKQHALCKNPVVTCPPFDLFIPHQCPEPQYRNSAPMNIASRLQKTKINPPFGGYDGATMNRKFVYSRFRPVRTYRDTEGSSNFTCCSFSKTDQFLFLGTFAGELKVYNIHTGSDEVTYACHESELTHCEPSRDGKLLLTSSAWRRPLSALWNFTDAFEMKHSFEEDYYMEFSKLSQERIVGTKYETAHVYDTLTGQLIVTLRDPDLCNNYTKNRATFDPSDELVLSDGVLWDVRSGKHIHKFDKFNPHINGVFHPNGLEIICNSEIWDLKTFHLLHTVPALDQCQITFNHMGDVIYGAMLEEEAEMDEDQLKSPYGSSFRTFDATDYSSIATIDIKKNIFDLATDQSDCFLAIVENQAARDSLASTESICRLYEVGRCREEDDEDAEEEEDDESDDLDDDDSEDDDADADDGDDDVEDNDAEPENLENDNEDGVEDMIISTEEESDDDNVLFALNTI